ncbi:hypothetical protein GX865_04430 [Candidatus Saccharibacteria bacterium]|nr:hypothetical protein [Candidatus Saccharibacteria bacterium]
MRKVAIYGNGGIGKSTIKSSTSVFENEGLRVMQIVCAPNTDSTTNFMHREDAVDDIARIGKFDKLVFLSAEDMPTYALLNGLFPIPCKPTKTTTLCVVAAPKYHRVFPRRPLVTFPHRNLAGELFL